MQKVINETGNVYGRLTVIERTKKPKNAHKSIREAWWLCECSCGNYKTVRGTHLRNGSVVSCGCFQKELSKKRRKDKTGKKYGRLTVIERAKKPRDSGSQTGTWWLCLCDCGIHTVIHTKHLRENGTKSCGCLQREESLKTHRREKGQSAMHMFFLSYKQGARKRREKINFLLSENQFIELVQDRCHYCGRAPYREYNPGNKYYGSIIVNGIDRVNSLKGYTIDNVVTCCSQCNFAKGTMPYESFKDLVKIIYDYWVSKNRKV